MKLGYPCINRSIGCTANSTFRLASYSEELLIEKVGNNLSCLERILEYNIKHGFLFFRISSDLVPFASHPVCKFDWAGHFRKDFTRIGKYIKKNKMRISMHPDQFVLINTPKKDVLERSIKELEYHCKILDSMKLDSTAKIQIHVGGLYGDRETAIARFVNRYKKLPKTVKKRLAIENDDRLFSLKDCLEVHKKTGIPVIFDSFHHECLNNGESFSHAVKAAAKTWKKKDGILMTDYSSQKKGARKGTHVYRINTRHFRKFINETKGQDFDVMLEIKDKEESALKAINILKEQKSSITISSSNLCMT